LAAFAGFARGTIPAGADRVAEMIPLRDDVPAKRYPVVTVLLILANIAVFAYELTLPAAELKRFIHQFGIVPSAMRSLEGPPSMLALGLPASLLTATFLHGGFMHLVGNMWFLWIFGDNVEDRMGPLRFLVFYLTCGVVAGISHIAVNPESALPSIGASGAVAGVLGAYLVSFPFARVLTLVPLLLIWPILELPAILVLGFWFLVQLLNGTAAIAATSETMGGVAWWAHIGGFVAGVLLIGLFARRRGRR
jgi:membrane associated rhomboid family serine protease